MLFRVSVSENRLETGQSVPNSRGPKMRTLSVEPLRPLVLAASASTLLSTLCCSNCGRTLRRQPRACLPQHSPASPGTSREGVISRIIVNCTVTRVRQSVDTLSRSREA